MDFNEHLELLVAASYRFKEERERPWGRAIIVQIGGARWLLDRLQAEAEETRTCLFDAGAWDDDSRTAIVPAPKGDELERRIIFPLDERPVGRSNFCLDTSARIWMRSRANKLHPRDSEEFSEELNVAQYVIQLLQSTRLTVVAT
jgi:hypothetical protein